MYYGAVQELAERILEYIRRYGLLKAGDRVGVAVSGGADSVALLRLLLELRKDLGIVLSVVHFNHKLRGAESEADEKFVAELAQKHRLELHSSGGDVGGYSAKNHLSVEAAGRELRYQHFQRLFEQGKVNRIATAHTLDDQAETVLLRLVRGAGTRGLAGIYPRLQAGSRPSGGRGQQERTIVRPLLGVRRRDLEAYLAAIGQDWREDSSNRDLRYARNRVRHGILPRLERNLNPRVREALAETAEIARAEEEYWEREVARLLPQVWEEAAGRQGGRRGAGVATQGAPGGKLKFSGLKQLPPALQRRLVRAVGECLGLRLEFRHVEEVLALAWGKIQVARSAPLPGGWAVSRERNELRFRQTKATAKSDYEYRLSVPGQVRVSEAGTLFEAVPVLIGHSSAGYDPEHVFDPKALAAELLVRNWRSGDRFWPAHSKSPKKIKELLQERQVSGPERQVWPVVVSGDKIVWVRGFPGSMEMRPPAEAKEAVMIRETPSKSA